MLSKPNRLETMPGNRTQKLTCPLLAKLMAVVLLLGYFNFGLHEISNAQEPLEQAPATQVETKPQSKIDAETQALHEKLSKYLTGTKWTGQFTMKGKQETRTEHYEILTAEKGEIGDYWNLVARIKYGDHDATLPLPPIEIKFAGETPVITVDNAFFPGFGNFDARVLIRKGQYAGTWAHIGGDGEGVGGHMFGTIEKMDPVEVKKKADAVEAPPKDKSEQNEDPKK